MRVEIHGSKKELAEAAAARAASIIRAAIAERDRLWEEGDADYYSLSDALQHLGNVAFRAPVPAYKHSAAVFLHLSGKIPSPLTHPDSARRPPWESDLLRDCAARLGIESRA
jgi:hypothetical protein